MSSIRQSSMIRRRKPENMMKQMLKNILIVQQQALEFNYRQSNLPQWVQQLNKFNISNKSAQLKKLTEPKELYVLLTKNFNPNPQKAINFSKFKNNTSSMVGASPRKKMLFKNTSTVSRFIKTQNSQISNEFRKTVDKKIDKIAQSWKNIDKFRQKHLIPPKTIRNNKIENIIQKVSERKAKTLQVRLKSQHDKTHIS